MIKHECQVGLRYRIYKSIKNLLSILFKLGLMTYLWKHKTNNEKRESYSDYNKSFKVNKMIIILPYNHHLVELTF